MQMPEHDYLILNFLVVNAYPREREAHLVGVNSIKIQKLSNYYVCHVIINSSTTTYYSLNSLFIHKYQKLIESRD